MLVNGALLHARWHLPTPGVPECTQMNAGVNHLPYNFADFLNRQDLPVRLHKSSFVYLNARKPSPFANYQVNCNYSRQITK